MTKTSSLALALALTLAACGQANTSKAQDGGFANDNRVVPGDSNSMKASFAPVVREAAPAVVNIAARGVQTVRDPFFGIPGQRETGSVGSGVIVRPNGVVVTNAHVIQGMSQIKVILNDRREFDATVVLADERSDIAVLQLQGVNESLPTLNIDDREQQQVGDLVLAIGNPFGVGQTVTNGIISALNRTETGIQDSGSFIQTDAAINPGNSGGALIDMDGDLIGINTAIFSRSGTSSGVGFAVPAVMVRRVVDSAVGGASSVERPWLGVSGDTVTGDMARSLGLDRPQGIVVTEVYPGGPADRAGIKEGDIITAIDGAQINDQSGLNFRVASHAPNETVQVGLLRDGRASNVNARVAALPGDAAIDKPTTINAGVLTGVQALELNPARAERLNLPPATQGVIIAGITRRTYAARTGLTNRDIIQAVNGRAVRSISDVANIQRGTEITIVRNGERITDTVR